jgi:hypothetical protein
VASYALIASQSTVQVLSATVVNNVVYCTIQTNPSGAIVSIPVQEKVFESGQAGPELTNLANAVEQVLSEPHVISAVGTQTIEASGLLADNVVFTVEYVPAGTTSTSVTAEATVPVGYLNFTDGAIGQASLANVENIIGDVYANLAAAAGG